MRCDPTDPALQATRARYLAGIEALLRERQVAASVDRAAFFAPDVSSLRAYVASLEGYRAQLRSLLGWPLTEEKRPAPRLLGREFVGEDASGSIDRLHVEIWPGVDSYALHLRPAANARAPLVMVLHGGLGVPELVADLQDWETNYHGLARRFMAAGMQVIAPQLALWDEQFGARPDRAKLEHKWREVGGGMVALELAFLQQWLDLGLSEWGGGSSRAGLAGFSWGGFYGLHLAALDPRITAAYVGGYFNRRDDVYMPGWGWSGSAQMFQDEVVAGMVCPRALYLEVGAQDELFPVAGASALWPSVLRHYSQLNCSDRVRFRVHPGKHEVDVATDGVDFVTAALEAES